MGWLLNAILFASVTGIFGGGIAVLGIIEAATGRIVINLRNLPWSRRDAQVIGLCRVAQGILITAQGAAVALMMATQLGVAIQFMLPAYWILMLLFGLAIAIPAALEMRLSHRTGLPLF